MFHKKAHTLLLVCLWWAVTGVFAQEQKVADSLAIIYLQNTLPDTARFALLRDLSFNEVRDLKKGVQYAEELINLSKEKGNDTYLRVGYFLKGTKLRLLGQLDEALEAFIKSAEIAGKMHHLKAEGETYGAIGDIYSAANNYPNAMVYYYKAITILRQSKGDSVSLASVLSNTGEVYLKTRKYDSALLYFNEAKVIFNQVNYQSGIGYCLGNIGMVYAKLGKNALAEKNINEAIRILEQAQDYYPISVYLIAMADVYQDRGDEQTALNYTIRSLRLAEQHGLKEQVASASLKASELYESEGNKSEALAYYQKHITYRDSINNLNTVQRMADLRTNYEVSQKQIEVDMLNQQKRNKQKLAIALGVILGLTIVIIGILLKNNRDKQKAYQVLDLQKQETDRLRARAEDTLQELQMTQQQLIQSAKMASLGELTAGIAHEIQNPLNFVNNFSEVSVELVDELREVAARQPAGAEQAKTDDILKDLATNLQKINYHGQRADSIIKGMLQHSRMSTGKKEPTDLNTLADEYLRLSYHGLRAKDNTFSASTRTYFDESIGLIEVVPQDIGRVLLNLFNNAFYAVHEKKKQGNSAFEPLVSVTTKRVGNKVRIAVRDNGAGIPQELTDKIFQPFFTTKPTGHGTGLGLSLSYDIIKAHGGAFTVDTEEGSFTEFIIELPINSRA
jgi:two-component system, NtrC family, sensor kinase